MKVIVIGAGFGGVATAIELLSHGFSDIVILEAADEIGGTWHYNNYPGAACDVPSHLYSYSYAQRPEWSRFCSPQGEILAYLRKTAADFGVSPLVITGAAVVSCTWDEDDCQWTVVSQEAGGETTKRRADAVVVATGQLNQPALPRFPGQDQFAGHSFHSARWDHDYDLAGKRVAVIGTGASAVQFVPEIAPVVEKLVVFQRTGNWFLPRKNHFYPASAIRLFQRVPALRLVFRFVLYLIMELITAMIRHPKTIGQLGRLWSTLFMRGQIPDPELRRKLWPNYTFGCKRVLFSSYFLPALSRENVEVVTEAVTEMTPQGPRTADGRTHEVDCVIYGTGFKTNDFMFPMEITGVGGRSLRDAWAGGAHAHLGMTVPGFPSLFILYGPNTNTSGGSIIFFLEAQVGYLRQALALARRRGARAVEVLADVEAASDKALQAKFDGTAWTRCDSWYRDDSGRIVANWPGYMTGYRRAVKKLNPDEYALVEPAAAKPAPRPLP